MAYSVPVRIDARYVEDGTDRTRGRGNFALRYKWEGGGLFGGRSVGFARRPEQRLKRLTFDLPLTAEALLVVAEIGGPGPSAPPAAS